MSRTATIKRTTGETNVDVRLDLDGNGSGQRTTGVGFFDHMLDLLARHAGFDLAVSAEGDLATGSHHTVEDVGICIGRAIDDALGDRTGIARYGHATIPMDEARATCAVDVSGRGLLEFQGVVPRGVTAGFEHELTEEFLRALAANAKVTLHLQIEAGRSAHHIIEACFKALARALRTAVAVDPRQQGVPSTKGVI